MTDKIKKEQPKTIYLKDYAPPEFLIDQVTLKFELGEISTTVSSKMWMRRNPDSNSKPPSLVLHGEGLELLAVTLEGNILREEQYEKTDELLTVHDVPDEFLLETITHVHPQDNTTLSGLYTSNNMFCTQCEAHGFRRITYFLDRPDVMAKFTTTLIAEKSKYPVLLSNGNPIAKGEFEDGMHWVKWEDPFKKPAYLFALVAGDLVKIEDTFKTRSGRNIAIEFYVEEQNRNKCHHAITSLQKAMKWDEEVYDREYDLDIYMVVAVSDFNMGAMENKGLNIFNAKYVLAQPETATDMDYQLIESVIGHEYFHNWTGNRITCRDWFQLSLKEGLTVFRDQSFSQDMGSAEVKRIDDVQMLRTRQFAEDEGPMSHPVRPDSYIEINNFYTLTVYEKGAEVIRMMQTVLGKEGFFKGIAHYFEKHDGQAVTTDDFVRCMEEANNVNLSHFRLWYSQAGTPEVTVTDKHDPKTNEYTLNFQQHTKPTPGQEHKEPLHIPCRIALFNESGKTIPLHLRGEEKISSEEIVLSLHNASESFTFDNVASRPIPSLFRNFSAIVKYNYPYQKDDFAFLMRHENDGFNRWNSCVTYFSQLLIDLMESKSADKVQVIDDEFYQAYTSLLNNNREDKSLLARMLALPSEHYIAEQMDIVDPEAIHEAREYFAKLISRHFREKWLNLYAQHHFNDEYKIDSNSIGNRSLKNIALEFLMKLQDDDIRQICKKQFVEANNMTDRLAALSFIVNDTSSLRDEALETFYQEWHNDPLVMDKWFAIQASSSHPEVLNNVKSLLKHPGFSIKNPNKVYALVGGFAEGNPAGFHVNSGEGYQFLSDIILDLNSLNPQVAARMLRPLTRWKRMDDIRQKQMQAALNKILSADNLSKDVYEIASKSINYQ